MIYCIEEDRALRDAIEIALCERGYTVKAVEKIGDELHSIKPRLVIADVAGSFAQSKELLINLRSRFKGNVALLLLVTQISAGNLLFDATAENEFCVTKPFEMKAFLDKIADILRNSAKGDKRLLVLGDIRYCAADNRLTVKGEPVTLTQKEYSLLYILLNSPGEILSRDRLFNEVWGSDYLGESRTVDVHIGTLRTKLGDAGKCIKTQRGKGYYIEACEHDYAPEI